MNVWMKVTNDIYELPIAVADTAVELSKMTGSSANSIRSNICHSKKKNLKSSFVKVEIKDYKDKLNR